MKKTFSIFLSLCLLLIITGCNKDSSGVTTVITGISFTAEIIYEERKFVCGAVIDDKGEALFTVESPEKIKGLKCTSKEEDYKIEFGGISYPLKQNNTVFKALNEILTVSRKNANNVSLKNDVFSLSGDTSLGKFELTVGESGLPISATIPEKDIIVYFKNVAIK